MRVLWFNIILAIGCLAFANVRAGDFGNIVGTDGVPSRFKAEVNNFMLKQFNLSLKYLLTGVAYGSQQVQRNGMAKYLRELSDQHWSQGIDFLKKYFARSGRINDVFFNFNGKNEIHLVPTNDMRIPYIETLEDLHKDSGEVISILNKLHKISDKHDDFHDADWAHFFEERAEKEVERVRQLKGFITTLEKMSNSSLALHVFDSHI
ncbi:hypothetical protein Anas_00318 [Armadillidium nasatum]|uniref:Ferritin-like diiron domain-containing protein n=1 Tax=Armadillidium nasatum TaxID=96803 RepID=A0A5N5TJX6_9CRUS|nr:hypothetical protein Anas_00318 [Armadillidium nasatum]